MHNDVSFTAPQHPPKVLCIAGHDPSGGAGIHADIEACRATGAHALGALTALTLQDTDSVHAVQPLDADWLDAQIRHLAADCRIDAVKFGVLGSVEQVPVCVRWVRELGVPTVLDPVLRAGGGAELAAQPVGLAMLEQLAPLCTVITPNAAEARLLSGEARLDAAAAALGARGIAHVLVTGGDERDDAESTDWHWHDGTLRPIRRARIAQDYHGAGCTLASTIAALLARGDAPAAAIDGATARVHAWLQRPKVIGRGRPSPARDCGDTP